MFLQTRRARRKTEISFRGLLVLGIVFGLAALGAIGYLNARSISRAAGDPTGGDARSDAGPFHTRTGQGDDRKQTSILHDGPVHSRSRDPDRFAAAEPSDESLRQRITARYASPVTARFLDSISTDDGLRIYLEASRLIDSRHLEPAEYDRRVRRAMRNLSLAVENPEFQRANRIAPSGRQIAQFRDALDYLLQVRAVETSGDALAMLYWTIDVAARHLGLEGKAVAVEFLHGATEALDRYSAFVPGDRSVQPSALLNESIVGIGAEIERHDTPPIRGVRVIKPLRGSPAEEAGLRPGDVITAVNGESLSGKSLDAAVELITGPAGSRVLLSILREGRAVAPISLVRRRMEIPSVSEVRMLDDEQRVGYIKLDQFTEESAAEMDAALWTLHRQRMKSLVLDLRGNPGGLLTTAIALADKFLPCGGIVSTRGRTREDRMSEFANYERTWKVPLVVLVDENSASASEIFAAAIQENERGLVVGRRTYGKGTVQTHFPLQASAAPHPLTLRLTTARFYSPTGRVMAGAGVEPDVAVDGSVSGKGTLDAALAAALEEALTVELREMALAKSGCRVRHRAPVILQG